jgi:hypothetical protein
MARGSTPPSAHTIKVRHFVVFKFEGYNILTVKVFGETMSCHHYHSDEDD